MASRKKAAGRSEDGSKLKSMLRHDPYVSRLREAGLVQGSGFVDREIVNGLAPALIDLLEDKNINVRNNALDLLGQLGPSIAQPVLLRLIESDSQELRDKAATELKKLERCGPDLTQPLLAAFGSPAWWVRLQACEALYRLENVDELTMPTLVNALTVLKEPRDTAVAETLAWLLARNGKNQAPELIQRLSHAFFAVRLGALKALFYLKAIGSALEHAKALLNDEMLPIRMWATVAIASAHTSETELQASVPSLTKVISTPWEDYQSSELKWVAVRLLASAGGVAATSVPAILANWNFGGTAWELPIEAFGASAIPHIYDAIKAGSVKEHDGLVWLAKLSAPGAIEFADRIVEKGSKAHYAATCYGLLGSEGLERARQLLKDPARVDLQSYVVQGLRHAGKEAATPIAEVLHSGSREGKQSAASVAGELRLGELEKELSAATKDQFEDVRIASACALFQLGRREASGQVLLREWDRYADHVVVAIVNTRIQATELLPLLLARLSEPDNCTSTAIKAVGVLAAAASKEERGRIVGKLRDISGLWDPLRKDAVTTAAKLENPHIEVPFPTALYGVS